MSMNDDESLLEKIHVLLDAPHLDECLLIVLVLLTRVTDTEKLQQTWTGRHALDTFCVRLLSTKNDRFIQIVARVVARLHQPIGKDIFLALLAALSTRWKAPLSSLDVDLILALHSSMQEDHDVKEVLSTVWRRFHFILTGETANEMPQKPPLSGADWNLVHDTLDALLRSEEHVLNSLNDAVWMLWNDYGAKACTALPSWYEPMVLSVTSESTIPPEYTLPWHGVVLQCTHALTAVAEFQPTLQHTSTATALIQLLQFHIVSNQNDVSSMAWTTLASLVEAFGFNWMNATTGSLSLGNATAMCTIVRLAAGEWRIQLGRLCVEMDTAASQLDSCGRVIVAALQYALQFTDEPLPMIPSAALLHLRDSFQDALHATVQYSCHPAQHANVQGLVGRVLASLLMEFDVWEGLPNGISTGETLEALSVALESTEDPCDILPCLMTVLASADGSSKSVSLLETHNLLGDTLVNDLVSFWKIQDVEAPQCLLACQVAELWYTLGEAPPKATAQLRKYILQWIQTWIENESAMVPALASAVDCYIMLCGQDTIPSEREAVVIQRALEICEAHHLADDS